MASDKAATQLLRVLSLNVHGWHNADKSSWEGLITMLKAMQPDVVALQEATKHRVPELAHELGDMHWTTRNNCAILSRLQLYVEHDQVRGCGRKKEERSGYAGKCKAAGAPLVTETGPFSALAVLRLTLMACHSHLRSPAPGPCVSQTD